MTAVYIALFAVLVIAGFGLYARTRPQLAVGSPAPDFRLPDQERRGQALSDYRGKRVVVHFFPMDASPETLAIVERFNALRSRLEATRAELLLVAVTDCDLAAAYADARSLYIPILCDNGKVARAYGAYTKAGPFKIARRMSVIIDAEGNVEQVFRQVESPDHVDALLKALGN